MLVDMLLWGEVSIFILIPIVLRIFKYIDNTMLGKLIGTGIFIFILIALSLPGPQIGVVEGDTIFPEWMGGTEEEKRWDEKFYGKQDDE
jgi:hypothetical protein